jgi:hypothetical protein
MKWLPKPSTRTALILGGIAAGLYAASSQGRFTKLQTKLQKQVRRLAA